MNISFNSEMQKIWNDIFVFSGFLSLDGYLLDLQGQIFAESGTAPELLVGHKFSETVFWQFQEHTFEILQKAIDEAAQGIKTTARLNFRVSAKKILNVELNLKPVYDELGSIQKILFYAVDVTRFQNEIDYHKTRCEHYLYAAEAAETGLWFWDLAQNEIFSTPKCNEFYGLPAHEFFTSDSFIKTLHPDDSARVVGALQQAQTSGEEYSIEFRITHADRSTQWLNLTGKTFFDAEQNPVSMMGVVRKITEKKLALDELAKVNESVRKARDEAEEANRAKDYFLAIVSHELR
ncbi:MAG: PAS domain-containing protein, partial [Pyrinomonadaceae bacterium]